MLLHLPRQEGWRVEPRVKNDPRWPATALKRCAARSPRRSSRCPSTYAAR